MASWISRTLTRIADRPSTPAEAPLPAAELRAAVESAKGSIRQGDFTGAGDVLANVLRSNPDNADALAYYGVATYLAGDPAEARNALTRAVRIDPDHLVAYKYLVRACNALGDFYDLEIAAHNALRLAPRDREVLNMYGVACLNRLDIEAAAESFSKAVEMAPTDIGPLLNIEALSRRSLLHRRTLDRSPKIAGARSQAINRLRASYRRGHLGDDGLRHLLMLLDGTQETFPAAVDLAHETARRDNVDPGLADELAMVFDILGDLPNCLRFRKLTAELDSSLPLPRIHLAYAKLTADIDRWRESWKTIREFERFSNLGIYASEVPSWTGQRLGKKKILVYQEQGMGDAILALRLVPMLAKRGVRFDLWLQPPLASLAGSVKGHENLVRTDKRPDARTLDCDFATTLFGLISALDVGYQEVMRNPTVLVPSADRMPAARIRLRALKGKRIGLAYGGNPDRRDDWYRTVPPAALKPLALLGDVSWVNLSIDPRPDKDEVCRMFRMDDPMKEASDFEDTAAIISELDAIVAIDSSAAHLAASLGKPVWVLVPTMLDWRWQIASDKSPWWPNVTLLRASALGVWTEVIEELASQIAGNRPTL
jgi:tetratricopeptide (TPR) repeat protein